MPSLEHLSSRTVSELRVTTEYLIAQSTGGRGGGRGEKGRELYVHSTNLSLSLSQPMLEAVSRTRTS